MQVVVLMLVLLSTSLSEVFTKTNASAALIAGIFHRKEVQTYRNISRTSFVCKCWWRLLLFCLSFLSFFLFFKKKIYGGHSLSSQLFFLLFLWASSTSLLSQFITYHLNILKTFNQHNLCFPLNAIVVHLCSLIYGLQVPVQSVKEHLLKEGIEVRI